MALTQIPNFLSNEECDKMIELIQQSNLQRSHVLNNDVYSAQKSINNIGTVSDFRTSKTGMLDPKNNFVIDLHEKIAEHLNLDIKLGEELQGQVYNPGEYFKPHKDYFEGDAQFLGCLSAGNRTHTFMIYLNDDFEGGETDFPEMGFKIKPQKGKAVVWENILPDNTFAPNVLHEGCPVISGTKYIITSWWRQFPRDLKKDKQMIEEAANKSKPTPTPLPVSFLDEAPQPPSNLPRCHPVGFKIVRCPKDVWKLVTEVYNKLKDVKRFNEEYEHKERFIKGNVVSSELIHIFDEPNFTSTILEKLRPLHQEFAGIQKIHDHCVYGIRSYLKDTLLRMHHDRIDTHHISSILIVDKDINMEAEWPNGIPDWPLYIYDHDGNRHKVYAEVGDLIMYESSVCAHGRPETFLGNYFRNMFIHYKFDCID